MARRRPFWVLDSETDPFEAVDEAICRRDCPTCGVKAENPCKGFPVTDLSPCHEDRRRIPQPFVWGLYGGPTGEEFHVFETIDDAIRFLESQNCIVYAHNGGKFDYHYLREYVNTDEKIDIIAGRLARFRIGECEFRDSLNILPVALKIFKKDEIDYALMEPDARIIPANREKIIKYLYGDCRYLYELITAHREENGVTLTQAGASMRAWSKQSKIKPPKQTGKYFHRYKPFYYGGRVQCFEQGIKQEHFSVYDMNSAYPAAMLHPHPFSEMANVEDHLPKDSELHKCLIKLKCCARGCFPFRLGDDPTKGELFYPHDESTIRRYYVTGYEFIKALEFDAIKYGTLTIETVHYFEQSVKFEDFILSQWDRRKVAQQIGNKALAIILKLLMNSLYGKFASDYSEYCDYLIAHLDDVAKYENDKYEGGPYVRESEIWSPGKYLMSRAIAESKHRYYNSATAASITGFQRAEMFEASMLVDTPIYGDTDSIACRHPGKLVLGDGLGEWKREGTFDEYAITGKKTYCFHEAGAPHTLEKDDKGRYKYYKYASKGVDLNPHELMEAAAGQEIEYKPMVPTYSVKRTKPKYINRRVNLTVKDIRQVPS